MKMEVHAERRVLALSSSFPLRAKNFTQRPTSDVRRPDRTRLQLFLISLQTDHFASNMPVQ